MNRKGWLIRGVALAVMLGTGLAAAVPAQVSSGQRAGSGAGNPRRSALRVDFTAEPDGHGTTRITVTSTTPTAELPTRSAYGSPSSMRRASLSRATSEPMLETDACPRSSVFRCPGCRRGDVLPRGVDSWNTVEDGSNRTRQRRRAALGRARRTSTVALKPATTTSTRHDWDAGSVLVIGRRPMEQPNCSAPISQRSRYGRYAQMRTRSFTPLEAIAPSVATRFCRDGASGTRRLPIANQLVRLDAHASRSRRRRRALDPVRVARPFAGRMPPAPSNCWPRPDSDASPPTIPSGSMTSPPWPPLKIVARSQRQQRQVHVRRPVQVPMRLRRRAQGILGLSASREKRGRSRGAASRRKSERRLWAVWTRNESRRLRRRCSCSSPLRHRPRTRRSPWPARFV